MIKWAEFRRTVAIISAFAIMVAGCGRSDSEKPAAPDVVESSPAPRNEPNPPSPPEAAPIPRVEERTFQPVTLGGDPPATDAENSPANSRTIAPPDDSADRILEKLRPLQIMLGQWEGKTRKQIGDFSAVYTIRWVWDFQTNPSQPALVMTTEKSPYFQSGRLTYLPDADAYQLTTEEKGGTRRTLQGQFTTEPTDEPGDGDRLQRSYRLELTEITTDTTDDPQESWQIVFNQQKNDRYLLELSESRGSRFQRFDTVASQRLGTSFALSDTDYGEKTCIISQGLGTIQVRHDGKAYWVCCTGCQAAFEESPEKWIAKLAERQQGQ